MTLPESMTDFLHAMHVLSLATAQDAQPWAASCFYVFDEADVRLIILSERATRHGLGMAANERVAGSIAGQPRHISDIRGIQFAGRARLLVGEAGAIARGMYCNRHPAARLRPAPVWELRLDEIKLTDNSRIFGRKTHWLREQDLPPPPAEHLTIGIPMSFTTDTAISRSVPVISAEGARLVIDAAMTEARTAGWQISVAVVDRAGELMAFERSDDAIGISPEVAIGKARTAARLRAPSAEFEDFINSGRPSFLATPGVTPLEGGLPLEYQGKVIGAVGVSGAHGPNDTRIARAAAAALT
jgi:glc operon protein GlcG